MKNKAEIAAIKEEVAALNQKLEELTEDELAEVTGGFFGVQAGLTPFSSQPTYEKGVLTIPISNMGTVTGDVKGTVRQSGEFAAVVDECP